MSRITKTNGILFTSFDYWSTPINTIGHLAYGVPIKVFDQCDLVQLINIGAENGFELIGKMDFQCEQKVVSLARYGLDLDYTFAYCTMRKK